MYLCELSTRDGEDEYMRGDDENDALESLPDHR